MRPIGPFAMPCDVTRPRALNSTTAADMVGLERLSKVPSWGRVTGPPSASARKTARELSINEFVSSKEPPSCSESAI